MVLIEHTYSDELTPEKIAACEAAIASREKPPPSRPDCSLLRSMRAIEERRRREARFDTSLESSYLVDSGRKARALIEAELQLPAETLELALRRKFMKFDPGKMGVVDIADFGALLTSLGGKICDDGDDNNNRGFADLEVNQDGNVRYDAFITWWLTRGPTPAAASSGSSQG